MLRRRAWRSVVRRFAACSVLLTVVSAGAFAFAPAGSAATQTHSGTAPATGGETVIPGTHPRDPLCQKTRRYDLALLNQYSNIRTAKAEDWNAYQRLTVAVDTLQSETSQAVLEAGKGIPANVRSAATKEVAGIPGIQKLVLKSKNAAGLNALMNGFETDLVTPWGQVLQYVLAQCGSLETDSRAFVGVQGSEVTVGTASSGVTAPTGWHNGTCRSDCPFTVIGAPPSPPGGNARSAIRFGCQHMGRLTREVSVALDSNDVAARLKSVSTGTAWSAVSWIGLAGTLVGLSGKYGQLVQDLAELNNSYAAALSGGPATSLRDALSNLSADCRRVGQTTHR